MYAQYPEYHTSLDNKSFIRFEKLLETVDVYFKIVETLEANPCFVTTNPQGEPQLGKRGLYPTLGGQKEIEHEVRAIMWALSFSDGRHGLLQIADRAGLSPQQIQSAAEKLVNAGLLQ
jgi:aminopeptidase-like protein